MRRLLRRSSLLALWVLLAGPVAVSSTLAGHGVEDTVDNITSERVKQLLDAGEKLVFIDLRPQADWKKDRLPGARSIPIGELQKRFGEVPKSGRVVLYCECKHAEVADRAIFLEYRGHRNVFVMPEGYSGWVKRGFPLEKAQR